MKVAFTQNSVPLDWFKAPSLFTVIYTLKKGKGKNTQNEYFTPVFNHKEGAMPPQTMYFNQIYTDVVLARARWFLNWLFWRLLLCEINQKVSLVS